MNADQVSQFESKLSEIYHKSTWLKYELSLHDFIHLFPIQVIKGKVAKIERPAGLDIDRDTYLSILVAFRQSFG